MYETTILKEDFIIKRVVTIHYFEYSKDYEFSGESHDFYEFVYVDKGEAIITDGENEFVLSGGDGFLHFPNVWHNIKSNGKVAPNLVIIAFECKSKYMNFYRDKIFRLLTEEKGYLASIIKAAGIAFKSPLDNPYTKKLLRSRYTIGTEQLIKIHLELLFISLFTNSRSTKSDTMYKEHSETDIVESIKIYLLENVHEKLKFSDIVDFAKCSPTSVKAAFKKREGIGVMTYFSNLKIERAKQYIREDNYNFTQISQILNYDSPHRFTKQFKAKTGMTPTEYSSSVKVKM